MKAKIPAALRQQVWLVYVGKRFENKCTVKWCTNLVNPFTFEVGHNVPESKGGTLDINNLRPLCSSCNRSMSDDYTIDEFSNISNPADNPWICFRFKRTG